MRKLVCLTMGVLFVSSTFAFAQSSSSTQEEIKLLRQQLQQIQQRLDQLEQQEAEQAKKTKKVEKKQKRMQKTVMTNQRKTALDRINFTGDFRFEANSISSSIPNFYNGMAVQKGMVDTMFYMGANGMPPESLDQVNQYIAQNYGQYQYFLSQLTWDQLKQAVGQIPPEMMGPLMQMILPSAYTPGYDYDNSILYTNRLRLNIDAKVADNVSFQGRLSMYKVWGDSTGVQVFNGQSNSFAIDGNTAGVPNSDILRVERAFFTWKDIGGAPVYLSIGRRPSTNGPPMNLRQNEMRGGTPMGSLIDMQFDGITFGWHIGQNWGTALRLCYGLGYESGYGAGEVAQPNGNWLDDASFLGLNLDLVNTDPMLIQFTIARAFNLTDGFGGLIVMPTDPISGNPVPAPLVMRYSPSANLGDFDIGGALLQRHDGPFDWFVNFAYSKSHPDNVTTPFGGLLSDPFETPTSHSGTMWYVGAKYNFNENRTAFGIEYNHGSKYWFNFTPAQDDLIGAKTATRGDVWEGYFFHKINKNFQLKLAYINYSYDYSGSGWHIGAPKKLDSTPILGFPTYDDASMFTLGLIARF